MMEKDGWVHPGYLWSKRRRENVFVDYLFDISNYDPALYDRMVSGFGNPSTAESMLKWPVRFPSDDEMAWEVNYGCNDNPAFALAIKYPEELFHLSEYLECSDAWKFFFRGIRYVPEEDRGAFMETDQNGKPVKSTHIICPLSVREEGEEAIIWTQAVFYPEEKEVKYVPGEDEVFTSTEEVKPVRVLIRTNRENFFRDEEENEAYLFVRDGSTMSFTCEEHDVSSLDDWTMFCAIKEGRLYPRISF